VFDFRYHALSLVSVFVALTVGLLLGIAVGDKGLVSNAEKDLRKSLRADIEDSRKQADLLKEEIALQKQFEEAVTPLVATNQLNGLKVGLVAFGSLDDQVVREVRSTLTAAGATLVSVSVVQTPVNLESLSEGAKNTRYKKLKDGSSKLLSSFSTRIGRQYVEGGSLIDNERRPLLSNFSGRLNSHDALIVVKSDGKAGEDKSTKLFEEGFINAVLKEKIPVVGVERSDDSPSQIEWFKERGFASIDNIEETAGKLSLVLTLDGASGAYGRKESADALLPQSLNKSSSNTSKSSQKR